MLDLITTSTFLAFHSVPMRALPTQRLFDDKGDFHVLLHDYTVAPFPL